MKRVLAALAFIALVLAVIFVARRERKPSLPNIVVITIDTLRSDHCSAYGYSRDTTPYLTRIAHEGARFESAYAVITRTFPSHTTLFTSTYPLTHGILTNVTKY